MSEFYDDTFGGKSETFSGDRLSYCEQIFEDALENFRHAQKRCERLLVLPFAILGLPLVSLDKESLQNIQPCSVQSLLFIFALLLVASSIIVLMFAFRARSIESVYDPANFWNERIRLSEKADGSCRAGLALGYLRAAKSLDNNAQGINRLTQTSLIALSLSTVIYLSAWLMTSPKY